MVSHRDALGPVEESTDSVLLRWADAIDSATPSGRPAVRVPASVGRWTPAARRSLAGRLGTTIDCWTVVIEDPEPAVLFAGRTLETVTPEVRSAAEAAIADVLLDCAWADRHSQ